MKISSFKIYQYKIPFVKPLWLKGDLFDQREGVIIHLTSDDGFEGFGECAPLPNFSQETLEDSIKQLKELKHFFNNLELPETLKTLEKELEKYFDEDKLLKSVSFGIESSLYHLLANKKQICLNKLLSDKTHDIVHINGLLTGKESEILPQAQDLLDRGFKALKLKVGSNVEEDIRKVLALTEILKGKAVLHVDANQAWSFKEATYFANKVGLAAIDYIEEPFKDIEKIPDFFNESMIPVALDESLREFGFDDIRSIVGVDVLILKPTLERSFSKICSIINQAVGLAIKTVISSSFESDIGLFNLAHLSGSFTRDNNVGIDTLKWFKEQLLKESLDFHNGKLDISSKLLRKDNIRFDLLKEL